ncbi:MAG: GAF domain-containing sensor histidine kinase [Anaerolineae bacterium]|nr:GAF domain-containing sensor histidine kinase [Anaerolineae bacterium]
MNSDKKPQADMSILLNSLNSIAAAVMTAAEASTLELVLERIAQVTGELIGAKYAALGIPDGRGGLTYFKVAGMTPDEISLMDHLPHGKGLLGAVMQERETLRLEHIRSDSRSSGFPRDHPMMDRFLGTPIQAGGQLFGMLYLCDRHDEQLFNEQDQWLVETIAGYAALAIAGSQLREQQSRLTLLEERERISMELHDGVIQSLYATGMHLELLRTVKQPEAGGLETVVHELNQIIDDIRNYIMDLHQKNTGQRSIRECLYDLVKRFHIPADIQVEIDAPDSIPLFSNSDFESICQLVNEAVSNAVRHAAARRIVITALQNERTLLISIKDNGQGFDPKNLPEDGGLGLRNMQQRVKLHGGRLTLESIVGEGTRLAISIPVQL